MAWRIQLLDGFALYDVDGIAIPVASRKARVLLALLAMSEGYAATRERLATELWLDKGSHQARQNLRQLLAGLDLEILQVEREACRLTTDITCDAAEVTSGRQPLRGRVFMSGYEEPAIEAIRREIADLEADSKLDAGGGLGSMLDWLLAHDPVRLIDLLYLGREQIPNLPIGALERVLASAESATPGHPRLVWGRLQLAVARMWQGDAEGGMRLAREALQNVDPEQEIGPWVDGVYAAAMFLIFRGKFSRAREWLETSIRFAESWRAEAAVGNLRHGLAHCSAYSGDVRGGLRILSELQPQWMRHAHRAIYHSFAGQVDEAREQEVLASQGEIGDVRLRTQLLAARGTLAMAEGDAVRGQEYAREILRIAQEYDLVIIEVQAIERLAQMAKGHERIRLAERAVEIRRRRNLPVLPIDRMPLGPFASIHARP